MPWQGSHERGYCLAEGPRLMSRVDGIAVDDVRIGMAVSARIIDEDGKPLLVFVPA